MKYSSRAADIMSFGQNSNVLIFSKGAGTDPTLWGVDIKGKRGYIPARFVREIKVHFRGDLLYEVSTAEELVEAAKEDLPPPPPAPSPTEYLAPTKAQDNSNETTVKEVLPGDDSIQSEPIIPDKEVIAEIPPTPAGLPSEPKVEERIPPTPYTATEPDVQNSDAQVVLETIPNISSPPQPPSASGDKIIGTEATTNQVPVTTELPLIAVTEANNEPAPQNTKKGIEEEAKPETIVEKAKQEDPSSVDKEDVDDDDGEDYDDDGDDEDEEDEDGGDSDGKWNFIIL